jgi:hypothetical protein
MVPVWPSTGTSMFTWTGERTGRNTWQRSPSPLPSARLPPAWKRTPRPQLSGCTATLSHIRRETSHVCPETSEVLQEVGQVSQEVDQVPQEVRQVRQEMGKVQQGTFTSMLG